MSAQENINPQNASNSDTNQQNQLSQIPQKSQEESIHPKTEPEQPEKLKPFQYMLTPLQGILLNKRMPAGFKLETEENVLKAIEAAKNQAKRFSKTSSKFSDSSKRNNKPKKQANTEMDSSGNLNQQQKVFPGDAPVKTKRKPPVEKPHMQENREMGVKNERYKIMMKCKTGLDKIKNHPNASLFYSCNQLGGPSLASIEKKLNNYEYKTIYDFSMDLRKMWSYFFKIYAKEPPTYEKIVPLSELSEKVCEGLDTPDEEIGEDFSKVKKRAEKLKKDFDEYKDSGNYVDSGDNNEYVAAYRNNNVPAPVKKVNVQRNNNPERVMSLEEKNQLGCAIRSLNKEQLRGIIKILSEPGGERPGSSKYFEFDIDKLPPKQLRELDKYVKSCLEGTKNNQRNFNKPGQVNAGMTHNNMGNNSNNKSQGQQKNINNQGNNNSQRPSSQQNQGNNNFGSQNNVANNNTKNMVGGNNNITNNNSIPNNTVNNKQNIEQNINQQQSQQKMKKQPSAQKNPQDDFSESESDSSDDDSSMSS